MGEVTADRVLEAEESKRHSLLAELFIRLVKEKPLGTVGAAIVLVCLFVAIFAEFLAPYGFNDITPGAFLKPPSARYVLGTDSLGRDMLSRIIFGARVSMVVGLCGTALATIAATIIGLISGFAGGKTDIVVQRIVDAILCFPGLLLMLSVIALIGQGMTQVILVLGVLYGIHNSRIVRGAVIAIREEVYVVAGRAIGCSTPRLLARHILPNVMAPIIVLASIGIPYMIVTEATLSFLGFGIPPPAPSWGEMLSGGGRRYTIIAPWLVIWPGLALSIVVFGANVLGDALRDVLDPRLRGGIGRYGTLKARKAAAKVSH